MRLHPTDLSEFDTTQRSVFSFKMSFIPGLYDVTEARGTVIIFSRRFFPHPPRLKAEMAFVNSWRRRRRMDARCAASGCRASGTSFRDSFVVFSAGERNEKCSATIRR